MKLEPRSPHLLLPVLVLACALVALLAPALSAGGAAVDTSPPLVGFHAMSEVVASHPNRTSPAPVRTVLGGSARPSHALVPYGASAPSAFHPATLTATVSTLDRSAQSNQGVFSVVVLPTAPLTTGQNWSVLVIDPINATEAIGVGLVGSEQGPASLWQGQLVTWNLGGTPGVVSWVNSTLFYHPGAAVSLIFEVHQGTWWSAQIDGTPFNATGTNGTFDLGTGSAAGFAPATAPFPCPTFQVQGNSTGPPSPLYGDPVLGYRSGLEMDPVGQGIWSSTSSGWAVAGEDQLAGLREGEVELGNGTLAAPANGTWLWGLGGPQYHPWANITTSVVGVYPNTGVGLTLNTTQASVVGTGATSYVVAAWEPLAPALTIGVGAWVNAPGGTIVPFFATNISGAMVDWMGDQTLLTPGVSLVLKANAGPTGNWSFTVGNSFIQGTAAGDSTNVTLGVPSAGPSTQAPYTTLATFGPSSFPPTSLSSVPVLWINHSGTWGPSATGFLADPSLGCLPCSGAAVQGFLQNPLVPVGGAVWGGSLPSEPVGTVLWNGTSYPTASVSWSGVPATVGSLATVAARVWVNGSGSPLSAPVVSLTLPVGVAASTLWYPSSGGVATNLTFALTTWVSTLHLVAQGAAPGWQASYAETSVGWGPGNLTVAGHLAQPSLLPGENGTVELWVNGTQGAGPLGGATLALGSALGGVTTLVGYSPTSGSYTLNYRAPSALTQNSTEVLSVLANVTGFAPASGSVSFSILPPSLSLVARLASLPLVSLENASVMVWVNSSLGLPLAGVPVVAELWAGPVPFGATGSTTSNGGAAVLAMVAPPIGSNRTLTLQVTATDPGYRVATLTRNVSVVLALLSVLPTIGPTQNGAYPIDVQVEHAGAPVVGASVTLSYGSGSATFRSATTSTGGRASFLWTPPSGGGTYQLNVTVSALGYVTHTVLVSIVVPPPSEAPILGLPAQQWLFVAPSIVVGVFLLLWAIGRRRALSHPPPGSKPAASAAAAAKGKTEGGDKEGSSSPAPRKGPGADGSTSEDASSRTEGASPAGESPDREGSPPPSEGPVPASPSDPAPADPDAPVGSTPPTGEGPSAGS